MKFLITSLLIGFSPISAIASDKGGNTGFDIYREIMQITYKYKHTCEEIHQSSSYDTICNELRDSIQRGHSASLFNFLFKPNEDHKRLFNECCPL